MKNEINMDLLNDVNFDTSIDFKPVSLEGETEKLSESSLRSKPIQSYKAPDPAAFRPLEKKEPVKIVNEVSLPSFSAPKKEELFEREPKVRCKTRSAGVSFFKGLFMIAMLIVGGWAVFGVSFDLTKNFWEGELGPEIECVKVHFQSVPSFFPVSSSSGASFYDSMSINTTLNGSVPQSR
ncbi:MAG: hypothetical protein Q4G69_06710 [Planctomycetia bacterium]|nr:hypothetical protein [Planctomycetia bacterium]